MKLMLLFVALLTPATLNAAEEDLQDCENTVRQGTVRVCGEHVNDFQTSCTDYWQGVTDFTFS